MRTRSWYEMAPIGALSFQDLRRLPGYGQRIPPAGRAGADQVSWAPAPPRRSCSLCPGERDILGTALAESARSRVKGGCAPAGERRGGARRALRRGGLGTGGELPRRDPGAVHMLTWRGDPGAVHTLTCGATRARCTRSCAGRSGHHVLTEAPAVCRGGGPPGARRAAVRTVSGGRWDRLRARLSAGSRPRCHGDRQQVAPAALAGLLRRRRRFPAPGQGRDAVSGGPPGAAASGPPSGRGRSPGDHHHCGHGDDAGSLCRRPRAGRATGIGGATAPRSPTSPA